MTALIYKAALPTYTSAEALTADAGESLLLNDAGTAYELLPGQSGAYVPGTDRLFCQTAFNATQTVSPPDDYAQTILTLQRYESLCAGSGFALGTKSIHMLSDTEVAVGGGILLNLGTAPSGDADLQLVLQASVSDTAVQGEGDYLGYWCVRLPSGKRPYLRLPFNGIVRPAFPWLSVFVGVWNFSVGLNDFGGMDVYRIA